MELSDLRFPVLAFNEGIVVVEPDQDSLTTCNTGGLKGGWYNELLLVDSTGRAIRVKGARKLHGVGRFWGYRIFLGQMIRVELAFEGEPFSLSLEEVKKRVLNGLRSYGGSVDPDYWRELRRSIQVAKTIPELIGLLRHHVWDPKEFV